MLASPHALWFTQMIEYEVPSMCQQALAQALVARSEALAARCEGLQGVTSRGKRAVEILSAEIYDSRLASRPTIVDRLLSGPVWDDDLLRPSMPAKGAKPPGRGLKRTG